MTQAIDKVLKLDETFQKEKREIELELEKTHTSKQQKLQNEITVLKNKISITSPAEGSGQRKHPKEDDVKKEQEKLIKTFMKLTPTIEKEIIKNLAAHPKPQ